MLVGNQYVSDSSILYLRSIVVSKHMSCLAWFNIPIHSYAQLALGISRISVFLVTHVAVDGMILLYKCEIMTEKVQNFTQRSGALNC